MNGNLKVFCLLFYGITMNLSKRQTQAGRLNFQKHLLSQLYIPSDLWMSLATLHPSYPPLEKSLSAWRVLAPSQSCLCWVAARGRVLPNVVSNTYLAVWQLLHSPWAKPSSQMVEEQDFVKGSKERKEGVSPQLRKMCIILQVNGIILCEVGLLDFGRIVHTPLRCSCKCVHSQFRRVENEMSC